MNLFVRWPYLMRSWRPQRILSVALTLGWLASTTIPTVPAASTGNAPSASQSANVGPYTAQQAMRGLDLYDWRCNACHEATEAMASSPRTCRRSAVSCRSAGPRCPRGSRPSAG
jgi:cytochrome c5